MQAGMQACAGGQQQTCDGQREEGRCMPGQRVRDGPAPGAQLFAPGMNQLPDFEGVLLQAGALSCDGQVSKAAALGQPTPAPWGTLQPDPARTPWR